MRRTWTYASLVPVRERLPGQLNEAFSLALRAVKMVDKDCAYYQCPLSGSHMAVTDRLGGECGNASFVALSSLLSNDQAAVAKVSLTTSTASVAAFRRDSVFFVSSGLTEECEIDVMEGDVLALFAQLTPVERDSCISVISRAVASGEVNIEAVAEDALLGSQARHGVVMLSAVSRRCYENISQPPETNYCRQ